MPLPRVNRGKDRDRLSALLLRDTLLMLMPMLLLMRMMARMEGKVKNASMSIGMGMRRCHD